MLDNTEENRENLQAGDYFIVTTPHFCESGYEIAEWNGKNFVSQGNGDNIDQYVKSFQNCGTLVVNTEDDMENEFMLFPCNKEKNFDMDEARAIMKQKGFILYSQGCLKIRVDEEGSKEQASGMCAILLVNKFCIDFENRDTK